MAQCPQCHALSRESDRYCGLCGKRLAPPEWSGPTCDTQPALRLADVHYRLGLVYARKGQYPQALAAWERALGQLDEGDGLRGEIQIARQGVEAQRVEGEGGGANPPIEGGDPPLHVVVSDGDRTIGRDPASDLTLDDGEVSARHARVTNRDGDLWVEALGSTNGTYINGQRISGTVQVRPHDLVRIGRSLLRLESGWGADTAGSGVYPPVEVGKCPGKEINQT